MEKLYEKRKNNYLLRIFYDKLGKELLLVVDTNKELYEIEENFFGKEGVTQKERWKLEHKTEYNKRKVTFNLLLMELQEKPLSDPKMPRRIQASVPYESLAMEEGDEKYEPMLEYFSRHIQPALGTAPERTVYIMDLGFGAGRINRFVFTDKFDTVIVKDPSGIKVGAGLILSGGACRNWGCKGDMACLMQKVGKELKRKVLEYTEKNRPVLGICMGHMLINYFLGGGFKAPRKEEFEEKDHVYYAQKATAIMGGIRDGTKMQYYHRGEITRISPELEVAGFSHHLDAPEGVRYPQGGPAIFIHKEKPVYSVFFHPEFSGQNIAEKFYHNFLKICEKHVK